MKNLMVVMAVMMSLMLMSGNVVSSEAAESVNAEITVIGTQKYYVPSKNETLGYIAQKFQVSVEALLQENPQLTSENLIYTGKQIKLPLYTAPPMATFSVPVPIQVTNTETTINNPTKEVQVVEERFTWPIVGGLSLALICMIVWLNWPRRAKKADTTVKPKKGETQAQYEARCRFLPKETPVWCFFGCEASVKGLTAGHLVRHHGRCTCNSNTSQLQTAA